MSIKRLLKGFKSFQADYFSKDTTLFDRLSEGQSPETMVIACSDSRIDPAIMTQSRPGDIFSVRNVAAMVAPYAENNNDHGTGAAVEYAVKALKVEHIVVLGHALCGGVRALAEAGDKAIVADGGFINQWINIGQRARRKVMRILASRSFEQKLRALEQASILLSLNNLMTYPWVKEAVKTGKLHLHGWYFDFPNGQLLSYDPTTAAFTDVLTNQGKPAVTANGGEANVPFSLVEFLQQVKDFTDPEDLEKTFVTLKKCNKVKGLPLSKKLRKAGYAMCGCCPAGAEETVASIVSAL